MAYIGSRVTFNNVPIDKLKVAMVSPMPSSRVLKEDQEAEIQNVRSDSSDRIMDSSDRITESSDRITKFKSGNSCGICGKYFKRKWVLRNHMTNDHDRRHTAELYRFVKNIFIPRAQSFTSLQADLHQD